MSRWFLRLFCMKTPSAEPPPVPPSSAEQCFIFFVFTFSSLCVSAPEQRGVSWRSSQRLACRLFHGCCFLVYRPCNEVVEVVVRGGICKGMYGEGWGSTPAGKQTEGTVLWTWLDLSHCYVSMSFPSSELLKIPLEFFFFLSLTPCLRESREKLLKAHKLSVVVGPVMLSESSWLPKTETWLTGKNHITPERSIPAASIPSPHTHLCWNSDDECEETVLAKEWVWDLCAMFWVEFKRSWDVSEEMRRLWRNVVKPIGLFKFLNQSRRLSREKSLTYIYCT